VLAKLGHVKMVMHRPLQGLPKQAIVTRTATGKWYVSVSCDEGRSYLGPCPHRAGWYRRRPQTFAYLSDGTAIENPRFFRAEEQALAKSAEAARAALPRNRSDGASSLSGWHAFTSVSNIAARTSSDSRSPF